MSILQAVETGDDRIRVDPPRASLEEMQLALSNRLELVRVERDVLGVAEHLKRIDPGLVLEHDKKQGIFILFWQGVREVDGIACQVDDLVGAYKELDQRIVRLIERIDAQGRSRHDLQAELDRLEREQDKERDWQFAQQIGDASEHLRHALRRDLNAEGSTVQLSTSRGIHKARREADRQARVKRNATKQARKRQRRKK